MYECIINTVTYTLTLEAIMQTLHGRHKANVRSVNVTFSVRCTVLYGWNFVLYCLIALVTSRFVTLAFSPLPLCSPLSNPVLEPPLGKENSISNAVMQVLPQSSMVYC